MTTETIQLTEGNIYHTLTIAPSGHLVASGNYEYGDAKALRELGAELVEGEAPHPREVMKVCPLCIKNAAVQSWHQEF